MSNYQHERGWLDSEVWGNTPYCERAAWSWIIGEAFWQDGIKNINGQPVSMPRGSFSHSLRFISDKWKWDKNKVDRFLKKLIMWEMIAIKPHNGTGQNIITVCNYDKYQNKSRNNGTEAGQKRDRSGTEAGQSRNQSNQSNQLIYPKIDFEEFYKIYPRRTGRKDAEKAYEKIIKKGVIEHEALIERVREYSDYIARIGTEKRFIPHPATWLNGHRWDDDLTAISGSQYTPNKTNGHGQGYGTTVLDATRDVLERIKMEEDTNW